MGIHEGIKSIPTQYAGIEFRSRLEAKWAAFFDQCGWKWAYEPLDMNGWIPDFAIGEIPTLVEVKPFYREEEWADECKKIVDSGCKQPVILFGADPTFWADGLDDQDRQIGWLFSPWEDRWEREPLHFGFTEGNGKLGLCPMYGGWFNYVWTVPAKVGAANKWARVWPSAGAGTFGFGADIDRVLHANWSNASNASQWRPNR